MAMKHATEYICGLQCKLRMMGIKLIGCTYIYADNQSLLENTTAPNSKLKKKSNSVVYYHVREGVSRDE